MAHLALGEVAFDGRVNSPGNRRIGKGGQEGLWITGLPKTVNLITVGQEYVSVGERVDPVYIDTAFARIAAR